MNIRTYLEGKDWACRLVGTFHCMVDSWKRYEFRTEKGNRVPHELRGRFHFIDRRKKSDAVVIVLAGYKEILWPTVFDRIHKYTPPNADVCIITSGLINQTLKDLCKTNGWSYLSTHRNQIALAQNIAINLHPDAKWICKLDEDMFVTDGYLEKLQKVHLLAEKETNFEIGFTAPLIPLNGYGHVRILELLNLTEEWEKKFGKAVCTDGLTHHTAILAAPDAAEFMWGSECRELQDIDALNSRLSNAQDRPSYTICPFRFSIGAILFTRRKWQAWRMFPIISGNGMGTDEEFLCKWCSTHSHAIVVAENTVIGHLGFGPQTKRMLEHYRAHPEQFCAAADRNR